MLSTLEDHHGEYSADPLYSVLEIIGTGITDSLASALSDYGFSVDSSTEERVVAIRSTSNQAMQRTAGRSAF